MQDAPFDISPAADQPLALLPVEQRAATIMKVDRRAAEIKEYVAKSKDIIAVIDPAGRAQAHRIAMDLRDLRCSIEKAGKAARDDATKFSKAVIAVEKQLAGLVEPEETRVLALRDGYDAKVKAEKEAAEKAERDRIAAIEGKLQSIRSEPLRAAGQSTATITGLIVALESEAPSPEFFEEYYQRAVEVHAEALARLGELHHAQKLLEDEQARQRAEAEAAAARIAAQAEENRRAAAELERQRAEIAAQQRAMEEQQAAEQRRIAAELQAERTRLAELERAAAERQAAEDARIAAEREAERQRMEAERAELQRQREEFEAQQRAATPAPVVVEKESQWTVEESEQLASSISTEYVEWSADKTSAIIGVVANRVPVPEPAQVIAFRKAARDLLEFAGVDEATMIFTGEVEVFAAEMEVAQ